MAYMLHASFLQERQLRALDLGDFTERDYVLRIYMPCVYMISQIQELLMYTHFNIDIYL